MTAETIRRRLYKALREVLDEQSAHLKEAKSKEFSSRCADCQQLIGREYGLRAAIRVAGGRISSW